MYDEMVYRAQRFINNTYQNVLGIDPIGEDGLTGWATIRALIRCLQHELGITALSDNFGPTTLATLTARWPVIEASTAVPSNVIRILQSALYCKGYDGGGIDGVFSQRVSNAMRKVKSDAGVADAYPGDAVVPKLFKALLTLDAYVIVNWGTQSVRSVQQWLNGRYVNRRNFDIIPCDGNFSRDVQKALMLAIQFEAGMSDDVANGVFGPGTQAALRNHTVSQGSTGTWVQLFSAGMVFNQRPGVTFTATFDADLAVRCREFQAFVKLPITSQGDYQTWASLLVSTGDSTRRGTACDGITEITPARARALRAAGYRVVGRYLSNAAGGSLDKRIKPGELATIVANGLRVFPIYQTWGGSARYFTRSQGVSDALAAIERARHYGFKPGTRIYFAVDFDAVDHEVTSNVIPHFQGIQAAMDEYVGRYEIGIYGPRNVCRRVADAGLTSASFVSDMSTGFSGNLGYPIPDNWAFDQISTVSVGSGTGAVEIDNDIYSGVDRGQNSFDPTSSDDALDVEFDPTLESTLVIDVRNYLVTEAGLPEEGGVADLSYLHTTTESIEVVLAHDALITRLARMLRMRKALVQATILWEYRIADHKDELSDWGVRTYYTLGDVDPTNEVIKNDGSTGLGQIFAQTAIDSRNYVIGQGIISGRVMNPTSEADLWEIWQKLNSDDVFNIQTVAHVLIRAAFLANLPAPRLDYNDESTRLVMRRYQGTGELANTESYLRLGLYRVLEKYNATLRGDVL